MRPLFKCGLIFNSAFNLLENASTNCIFPFLIHETYNLKTMKANFFFLLASFILAGASHSAAQPSKLFKTWTTDTLLTTCESVFYDSARQVLYVSNIEGESAGMDGKGSIAQVGLDGKIINARWVTGLNAPKGMGVYKNTLWVTDLNALVAIDIKSGKATQRIQVENARFLNDLTIDKAGVVYASDTRTKKVHQLKDGKVSTYLSNLQSPNGLLAIDNVLYVLDNGRLLRYSADKKATELAKGMESSTDGIVQVQPNEFVISSWAGVVYYVKSDGTVQQLLDTRAEKSNTADIGYNAKSRIVYIPTFFKNKVVAYELK